MEEKTIISDQKNTYIKKHIHGRRDARVTNRLLDWPSPAPCVPPFVCKKHFKKNRGSLKRSGTFFFLFTTKIATHYEAWFTQNLGR